MLAKQLVGILFLASHVIACASHDNHYGLVKRDDDDDDDDEKEKKIEEVVNPKEKGTATGGEEAPPPGKADWAYEAPLNWNRLNPDYSLCQTGTQQSPIPLSLVHGLAVNHVPHFNYPNQTAGNFYNWGYGPAFTVSHPRGEFTGNPSFTYDNMTLYLKGWHIHTPADHSINGAQSKAELHLVHGDAQGREKAVLAILLNPGNVNSPFLDQLPPLIGFNNATTTVPVTLNLRMALETVDMFREFWTYQGSLTSPPCTEGIRWFVARQPMVTSLEQMRALLGSSAFSARPEQQVWKHNINV